MCFLTNVGKRFVVRNILVTLHYIVKQRTDIVKELSAWVFNKNKRLKLISLLRNGWPLINCPLHAIYYGMIGEAVLHNAGRELRTQKALLPVKDQVSIIGFVKNRAMYGSSFLDIQSTNHTV